MWHVWRTAELYKVKPDGKKAKEETVVQKGNIEMDLQKNLAGRAWNRLIWLRVETCGVLL